MQFWVLVEVLFCESDGRGAEGACSLGCWWPVLFCESAWPSATGHAVWGVGGGAALSMSAWPGARGHAARCRCCFARVAGC